jgi:hypothetical protein
MSGCCARVTIISHRREVAYTRFVRRNDAEYNLFSKALSRSDWMRTRHGCPAVHTRRRHARIHPCVSKWQQLQEAFFSGSKDRRMPSLLTPFFHRGSAGPRQCTAQGSRGLCGAHPVRSMCIDDTCRSRSMTTRRHTICYVPVPFHIVVPRNVSLRLITRLAGRRPALRLVVCRPAGHLAIS